MSAAQREMTTHNRVKNQANELSTLPRERGTPYNKVPMMLGHHKSQIIPLHHDVLISRDYQTWPGNLMLMNIIMETRDGYRAIPALSKRAKKMYVHEMVMSQVKGRFLYPDNFGWRVASALEAYQSVVCKLRRNIRGR